MGDYTRTTRECAFEQLRPELVAAIREHVEKHNLGNAEAEALVCCETTSQRRKKPGLISRALGGDPDKVHYTAAIVTPRLLIWGTSGEKRGTAVLSVRLSEAEARDYASGPFAKMVADSGIDVTGMPSGGLERVTGFIGLGEGLAAERFKEILFAAAERAKT